MDITEPKTWLALRSVSCACFVALLTLAVNGESAGLNILSKNLEISGNWTESWYTSGDDQTHEDSGVFNEATTLASSLGMSVSSAPFGWGQAGAMIESFSLSIYADSAPASLDYDWGTGALSPTVINLYATATTRFLTDGPELRFSLTGLVDFNYGPDEQDVQVTLKDLTAATDLLSVTASLDWPAWREPGFSAVYFFPANGSHEYELVLSGWINSWDSKYADLDVQVQFAAVPEPRTWLLLMASLGVLAACRKGKDYRTTDHGLRTREKAEMAEVSLWGVQGSKLKVQGRERLRFWGLDFYPCNLRHPWSNPER